MNEFRDGRAFLAALKEQNRKERQRFSDFSRYLNRKAREAGVPLNGQFELTPLCNFRCEMCYVRLSESQMSRQLLTPVQWKDLISQAVRAGMLSATLSGGECLTYPGFKEVYEHIQSLGCEVEVFTNGSLLDESWIGYFKQHQPAGLHVTLYGDSEDAYERVTGQRAYERVLHNIRRINEEKLPLYINVTPNPAMGEDVFGTIRLARELSRNVTVNHALVQPRQETGREGSVRDLDEDFYIRIMRYHNELKGIRVETCPAELPPEGGPDPDGVRYGVLCGAGRSGFNFNWDGVMTPCNWKSSGFIRWRLALTKPGDRSGKPLPTGRAPRRVRAAFMNMSARFASVMWCPTQSRASGLMPCVKKQSGLSGKGCIPRRSVNR